MTNKKLIGTFYMTKNILNLATIEINIKPKESLVDIRKNICKKNYGYLLSAPFHNTKN